MGDNKAQFPILSTDNSHTGGIASASDQYLRRGDFIRLRDLTLGYNFSKSLLTRLHFTGTIAVYAQVTNLFTYKFDKKPNYAPEIPENGLWEFRNPAMRTFSIVVLISNLRSLTMKFQYSILHIHTCSTFILVRFVRQRVLEFSSF